MSLRLIAPGLHALLVDAGRPRSRSLGVPVGGAADRTALALGNALVGNPSDTLALEFTLAGPTLEAILPTAGVVFGAPFAIAINGKPASAGTTFSLQPGDQLRIGGTSTGARGYLCVAGGFDGPVVLGSRSSLEPLAAGEMLSCPSSRCEPRGLGFVNLNPSPLPPPLKGEGEQLTPPSLSGKGVGGLGSYSIRVLDGPQCAWFTDESFFTQTFDVSPASNRMGLRLKGVPLARAPGELASEAVAPGAVQITNDGLPVVLGIDGQTIGGYPKIAHVIRADLDLLAQLRPGDNVNFVKVTNEEAERAARDRATSVREWLARIRAADREPLFFPANETLLHAQNPIPDGE